MRSTWPSLGKKGGRLVRSSPCPPDPSTLQRAPLGPVDGWKKLTARVGGGEECSPGRWAYVAAGVKRFGQEREEGVTTCFWILAILR